MLDRDKNSLDKYLEEIGKGELLTEAEEKELSERIRLGDSRAMERLTTANLRLVVTVARQYLNQGVDMADLISEGNIGLMKAAERYDAGRGTRFASYAVPFVRKCMMRAIDEQSGLYRVPKDANTSLEKRRSKAVSADAPLGGRDNVNLLNLIVNNDAPPADATMNGMLLTEELERMLGILDEREKEVVVLFFGIGGEKLTMMEIGERMGLKRERVRQIRKKALLKISRHAGSLSLGDYLEH